jgi:uncharacterized protein
VPGSREPEVVGRLGEAWKLRVTPAAERGKANEAAIRLLAERLRVGADDIRLVAGHASRDKVVEVTGLDAGEAERRLAG